MSFEPRRPRFSSRDKVGTDLPSPGATVLFEGRRAAPQPAHRQPASSSSSTLSTVVARVTDAWLSIEDAAAWISSRLSRLAAACASLVGLTGGTTAQVISSLLRLSVFYGLNFLAFGYLEEPGWSALDSVYYSTVIMSTVGYGDISPTTPATRVLSVLFALLGFILVFAETSRAVDMILHPAVQSMRNQLDRWFPLRVVSVQISRRGKATEVPIPNRASIYLMKGLSPLLLILIGMQFSFAALLCAVQSMDFGLAFYHLMITSTTVGLGDVAIETRGAKCVMVLHILLTVGTLSSIVRELGRITEQRKKMINRVRLMMRKVRAAAEGQANAREWCGGGYRHTSAALTTDDASRRSTLNASPSTTPPQMDPNLLKELEESYLEFYVKRKHPAALQRSLSNFSGRLSGAAVRASSSLTRASGSWLSRQGSSASRASRRSVRRSSEENEDGRGSRRASEESSVFPSERGAGLRAGSRAGSLTGGGGGTCSLDARSPIGTPSGSFGRAQSAGRCGAPPGTCSHTVVATLGFNNDSSVGGGVGGPAGATSHDGPWRSCDDGNRAVVGSALALAQRSGGSPDSPFNKAGSSPDSSFAKEHSLRPRHTASREGSFIGCNNNGHPALSPHGTPRTTPRKGTPRTTPRGTSGLFGGEEKSVQRTRSMRDSVTRRASLMPGSGRVADGEDGDSLAEGSSTAFGMDKAEFVVGMLVLLGAVEWEDADAIMEHFDTLDINGDGTLNAAEFQAAAESQMRRSSESGLEELASAMAAVGITMGDPKASSQRAAVFQAKETETAGDYASAAKQLEEVKQLEEGGFGDFEENGFGDSEAVRTRVHYLVRLGEMRWRYRVVEKGQSPLQAAVEVLKTAEALINKHRHFLLSGLSGEEEETAQREFEREWAGELSDVLQGLSAARLIFNMDRSEDPLIEKTLMEALQLREGAELLAEKADTLNSLGMLRIKQKRPEEAHTFFLRSLEVRNELPEAKVKQQAIAQSYVSLGNLAIERGDAAAKAKMPKLASQFYVHAVEDLRSSQAAYIRGFSAEHPKVAWALEGLAKVHLKLHALSEAQAAVEEAITIRQRIQASDPTKEMFKKELSSALELKGEILKSAASA